MDFRKHVLGTFMVRCKVKTPKGMILETDIPTLSEDDGKEFMEALNKAMASKPPKLPKKTKGKANG
jgi:hypothetical protein